MSLALRFKLMADPSCLNCGSGRMVPARGTGVELLILRDCEMSGVEELEDAGKERPSFSRSEAFVGGDEPRGDGLKGDVEVRRRDSDLAMGIELRLASEILFFEPILDELVGAGFLTGGFFATAATTAAVVAGTPLFFWGLVSFATGVLALAEVFGTALVAGFGVFVPCEFEGGASSTVADVSPTSSNFASSSESRTNSVDFALLLVLTAGFFVTFFATSLGFAAWNAFGLFDRRRLLNAAFSLILVFLAVSCDLERAIGSASVGPRRSLFSISFPSSFTSRSTSPKVG